MNTKSVMAGEYTHHEHEVSHGGGFQRTMNTKSVMAGEYTAPPAQGPMMREICRYCA